MSVTEFNVYLLSLPTKNCIQSTFLIEYSPQSPRFLLVSETIINKLAFRNSSQFPGMLKNIPNSTIKKMEDLRSVFFCFPEIRVSDTKANYDRFNGE